MHSGGRSSSSESDVLVVGAGAAGLTAALRAAEAGAHVTLLNAHPKIGLKILMSGGTRCNVTHREVDERDFAGGSRAFVARVLRAFPAEEARGWLESLGIALKLEPTGKYFPVTDDAHTVLEALESAARRAGVEVVSGARVVRLTQGSSSGGSIFQAGIQRVRDSNAFFPTPSLGTDEWPLPEAGPDEWRTARTVVLATGGLSFPRTGSDGTGYALARSFGHSMVPPIPALTPLSGPDPLCQSAQGITLDAELALWTERRRAIAIRGSLLIAHFGFSGPAALDLSRHWLRADPGSRRVTASFLPEWTFEHLRDAWLAAVGKEPRRSARKVVTRWIPERLAEVLCEECGIDASAPASQVDRARRATLFERLLSRPLDITGTLGYEKAECTAGGIALSEVNPSTLESRKARGLYLCGEILDVEGRLGGFNFQWAWSSGTVAGRAASK